MYVMPARMPIKLQEAIAKRDPAKIRQSDNPGLADVSKHVEPRFGKTTDQLVWSWSTKSHAVPWCQPIAARAV
jgi:hypothetical protein